MIVEISTRNHELLARVTWTVSEHLEVEYLDDQYEQSLKEILNTLQQSGIPYRTGETNKLGRISVTMENQIIVYPSDESFLRALPDELRRFQVHGHRIFGILKEKN